LAEIFKEVGLIEKYGSGVKRAVAEIVNYNLPKPEIKEISGGINVDIFAETKDLEKDTAKDTVKDTVRLSKNEELMVDMMRKNPVITADELSEKLRINLRNTKKNIAKLKESSAIQRIGPDKGGHWKVLV
jgi:ATP-dependent DNA helicase RecG